MAGIRKRAATKPKNKTAGQLSAPYCSSCKRARTRARIQTSCARTTGQHHQRVKTSIFSFVSWFLRCSHGTSEELHVRYCLVHRKARQLWIGRAKPPPMCVWFWTKSSSSLLGSTYSQLVGLSGVRQDPRKLNHQAKAQSGRKVLNFPNNTGQSSCGSFRMAYLEQDVGVP